MCREGGYVAESMTCAASDARRRLTRTLAHQDVGDAFRMHQGPGSFMNCLKAKHDISPGPCSSRGQNLTIISMLLMSLFKPCKSGAFRFQYLEELRFREHKLLHTRSTI